MRGARTMIRLHKYNLDEIRKELNSLEEERSSIVHALDDLAAELHREQQLASQMPSIPGYAAYGQEVIRRREHMHRELAAVEIQIVATRERLQLEFEEMKRFELMDEAAKQRVFAERARKEQSLLDEIAINQHRRRQIEGT